VPSYIAEYVRNCKIVRITAKKSQWGRCWAKLSIFQ
jgi:hypothetical protein